MKKFFDQNLESKNKNNVQEPTRLCDVLITNIVGFYFDAQWCTHNQEFLKKLKNVYHLAKHKKMNFEIIYVSGDEEKQTSFENYQNSHPDWFFWPHENGINMLV